MHTDLHQSSPSSFSEGCSVTGQKVRCEAVLVYLKGASTQWLDTLLTAVIESLTAILECIDLISDT